MTSLGEIYQRFPSNEAAIAHLERVRWPKGLTCVYCGADTVARHNEASRRDRLQCCSFSATVGTIFHNSHVDLQRWFLLIALMLSAMQAARDLDMRRPTVWSMMHRVRGAMQDDGRLLAGLVEINEVDLGVVETTTRLGRVGAERARHRSSARRPVRDGGPVRRSCLQSGRPSLRVRAAAAGRGQPADPARWSKGHAASDS